MHTALTASTAELQLEAFKLSLTVALPAACTIGSIVEA
jgi:hypothetical protein